MEITSCAKGCGLVLPLCQFQYDCENRPNCKYYHYSENYNICRNCEPYNLEKPYCKGNCGEKLKACRNGHKCPNLPNCWFYHPEAINANKCRDCRDEPYCDCGIKLRACVYGNECQNLPNCWFYHPEAINANICKVCRSEPNNQENQINQHDSVKHCVISEPISIKKKCRIEAERSYKSEVMKSNNEEIIFLKKIQENMNEMIESKNKEIIFLKEMLDNMDEEMESKNEEIISLKEMLVNKDEVMKIKNEEMKSKNKEIIFLKEKLENMDEEMDSKNEEMDSKNEEIGFKNEEIISLKEKLENMDKEMKSKNDIITKLENELEGMNEENKPTEMVWINSNNESGINEEVQFKEDMNDRMKQMEKQMETLNSMLSQTNFVSPPVNSFGNYDNSFNYHVPAPVNSFGNYVGVPQYQMMNMAPANDVFSMGSAGPINNNE